MLMFCPPLSNKKNYTYIPWADGFHGQQFCTRFLLGTTPLQAPGSHMGVSLLYDDKRIAVSELYFTHKVSRELTQLKCFTHMKGSHALTASFSIRVANRGQCKLNKCLSLSLSLTDLVTALERNCRNWGKCKHRLFLAPFLCWTFCPRPRETMDKPVCRLWPVLGFSASLRSLPSCSAKGFSLKQAFCLNALNQCRPLSRAVI